MTAMASRAYSASAEERAQQILGQMTLDEKLAQLGGVWLADLVPEGTVDPERVLDRIPHGIGQITRIGATTALLPQESARLANQLQKVLVERTRLGIPALVHEESLAGYCARGATVFPQAIGLASTWDPALVQEVADTIRRQLMAVGARQSLAPVLDVARDPRWGRVEETYGEDPVLAGAIGAAYVRGMQTDDLHNGVLATGKHFVAHSLPEGGRNHAPVHVGPRELREVFAEPFAAAIREAGLASVMNSYSSVDGVPCAASRELLTGLLREELGFDGVVVADYFSVGLLASYHRVASGRREAARRALSAGIDIELPVLDCFGEPLREALDKGEVPIELVDAAVFRVLVAKARLGLFENPYVDESAVNEVFSNPRNVELARRVATKAIILLSNDGVLPLRRDISRIAVIGPGANNPRLMQGDYHYPAHQETLIERAQKADGDDSAADLLALPGSVGTMRPGFIFTPHVTPLAGIIAKLGPKAEVTYVKGCDVSTTDNAELAEAVEAAKNAQVAVVIVGGRSGLHTTSTVGEARDATDLRLTGLQEELVRQVAATGTPTVCVIMSGRVHELEEVVRLSSAVLQVWPPGEQGGTALADVLFGDVEPGGRLPVTLPRRAGQIPLYHSHRGRGDKSMFYGDYTDCPHTPLFPFGHGLSYTSFVHASLEVEGQDTQSPIQVKVLIANTGNRPGEEVVQIYATDLVASVSRPERQLVAFARVPVDPGMARWVSFRIPAGRLAFYDQEMNFVVEPGEFVFATGSSAGTLLAQTTLVLDGPIATYSQANLPPTKTALGEQFPWEP